MEVTSRDKTLIVIAFVWLMLFGGPGALLFNVDVYLFNMPLLWVSAIVGWLISIPLIYFAGYRLHCTNVEITEEEEGFQVAAPREPAPQERGG